MTVLLNDYFKAVSGQRTQSRSLKAGERKKEILSYNKTSNLLEVSNAENCS